ncbi:cytosolic Fe-S cluster assembly factor NAR1, putative [Plasmodium vivax]|nr:cytosolic Fe-S cluster assembly factor NAR1, putative [Plasmodium vivax]
MFSNAIKLENLNDYYNEEEECIKPFLYKSQVANEDDLSEPNLINIKKKSKEKKKKERGEISLTDCLACSGCVTNEETNFLRNQNAVEILNQIRKKKINIISLSLQSITALSVHYNLPIQRTQKKLCFLLKSLGFDYVYDSSLSELIALNESKREFISHFVEATKTAQQSGHYQNGADDILGGKRDHRLKSKRGSKTELRGGNHAAAYTREGKSSLPLICSHCSGTVIYGEKNFDEEEINSFSKVKSSQDIQGIILKILHLQKSVHVTLPLLESPPPLRSFFNWYCTYGLEFWAVCRKHHRRNHGLLRPGPVGQEGSKRGGRGGSSGNGVTATPPTIYDINHVYLLYCFDKKLEAHRSNLPQQNSLNENMLAYLAHVSPRTIDPMRDTPNADQQKRNFHCVDAVLTTVELVELINNTEIDFASLPEMPIDSVYDLLRAAMRGVHADRTKRNPHEAAAEETPPTTHVERTAPPSLHELSEIYDHLAEYTLRCGNRNNISMGYGEEMFKYVCREVFNFEVDEREFHLQYHDIVVLSLLQGSHCVFRVILSYGFKSMYSVVRKVKEGKSGRAPGRSSPGRSLQRESSPGRTPPPSGTPPNPPGEANKYDVEITYNLHFTGRIDYIELMACEKGCLFGCAQNIFSEPVHRRTPCLCYNSRIFKKIAQQEVIENFDFLRSDGRSDAQGGQAGDETGGILCASEKHTRCEDHMQDADASSINQGETQTGYELFNQPKVDTEKLFQKMYDTMHSDQFTVYVNSSKCDGDISVNSFLKNIGKFFNTETFHILGSSFSSKKKVDIINW